MRGSAIDPIDEQLKQLSNARKLVLGDTSYYPQIVQGVLPILQNDRHLPIRRWGSEFIAEVFASPALKMSQKETICLLVLETLKNLIQDPNEDSFVLRNAIQTCASIYPLVFNWVIANSYDNSTWDRVLAIKAQIFHLWDTSPSPVRICCIKFAQRVILAQTIASTDRQRGDLNVNIVMVPANHPLLEPRHLEGEAMSLLDRMLKVLQESNSDAIIVDATLNCMSILVRTRPATTNRIITMLLAFNPFKIANSPMSPRTRVLLKSMEKTTRMLLMHLHKRVPPNPNTGRLQQHAQRLMASRLEILDEAGRKRAYGDVSWQETTKRQKLGANVSAGQAPDSQAATDIDMLPLGRGPHTLANVFTFCKDRALASFDATQVPLSFAVKISILAFRKADPVTFFKVLDGVRTRMVDLARADVEINPETAPLGVEEEEDDYEPDFDTGEDAEQILNKLDSAPPEGMSSKLLVPPLSLGLVNLPPAPVLNPELAAKVGRATVSGMFSMMQDLEEPIGKRTKTGIARLAAGSSDRESWVTTITRLATRASAGLDQAMVKKEGREMAPQGVKFNESIRELLFAYVMEDFRRRIEVAVSWLCEEWYNDQVMKTSGQDAPLYYEKWVLKVMDGFLPYLGPQDKVFTRFLSEMPELNKAILSRVKGLCRNPTMSQLVTTSLYYLVMLRPPVRHLVLDTLQDIWKEFEDTRPFAEKHLSKWRPEFLSAAKSA